MNPSSRRQILSALTGSAASALLHNPSFAQVGAAGAEPALVAPVLFRPSENITDVEWASGLAVSNAKEGVSLLVEQGGSILREAYSQRNGVNRAWNLYSGTKGLNALYAAILVGEGLIDLDEPVCETLPQWRNDPRKKLITPAHLLTMTSGIQSRGQFHLDTPAEALQRPCVADPGTAFIYGPAPVQCFAALVSAKLAARGAAITDPQADLTQKLLVPLSIAPQRWDRIGGSAPNMVVNCYFTARQWARIGRFLLDGGRVDGRQLCDPTAFTRILTPSSQNIAFGMSWWVSGPQARARHLFEANSQQLSEAHKLYGQIWASGGYYAQRLIILPQRDMVIVRQAPGSVNGLFGRDILNRPIEVLSELKLLQAMLDKLP